MSAELCNWPNHIKFSIPDSVQKSCLESIELSVVRIYAKKPQEKQLINETDAHLCSQSSGLAAYTHNNYFGI